MRRSAGNPINFFQNISHLPGQSSLLFCIDLIEYNIKAAIPYSLPSTGFTCKQLCQKFRCQLRILRNTKQLCGKSRPGHFRGVCTVVSKLFNIVTPDRAYFGQKDAQQLAIIRKMVRDLNFDIEIVGCPIIREEDGLAKSSRNTYLSQEERKAALCLSKAVKLGQETIHTGIAAEELLGKMRAVIEAEPLAKIDYVSMVDALTMQPVEKADRDVLVAMAVYIGKTRLIDNFSYEV